MNKRKIISIIIYVAVLGLLFSWMLGIFGDGNGGISYSEVIKLFKDEKVSSFVVEDNVIYLKLNAPQDGKDSLQAPLADPDGFHAEMKDLFAQQQEKGILKEYHYVPEETTSPYGFILPIVLAGLVLIVI